MPESRELGNEGKGPDFVDRFLGAVRPPSRRMVLTSLPATYEERPIKAAAGSIVVGLLCIGISVTLAIITADQLAKRFDWFTFTTLLGPLAFLVVGTSVCVVGILVFFRRTSITITPQRVSVRHDTLRSACEWSEPLSQYVGVLTRTAKPKHRREHSFVLELLHDDPSRTVLLYASDEPLETALQWQPACAVLGLPPYTEVNGQVVQAQGAFGNSGDQEPSAQAETMNPDDPYLKEVGQATETPETRRARRNAWLVNAVVMLVCIGFELLSCFSRKRTADLSGKGIAIMPAPPP